MSIGPGKYDDLCTYAREKAEAVGVILIVIGGNQGPGFCVQAPAPAIFDVPGKLEEIARQMRADFKRGKV